MVYFIKNLTTGHIKIGSAKKPEVRLKQLQTASSDKLVLVTSIEGGLPDERALHKRFAHLKLEGEWFRFEAELFEYLAPTKNDVLLGKYFHTYTDKNKLHWQGRVVSVAQPGFYVVQLYSWLTTGPTCQRLVSIHEMTRWDYYDVREDWLEFAKQKSRQSE